MIKNGYCEYLSFGNQKLSERHRHRTLLIVFTYIHNNAHISSILYISWHLNSIEQYKLFCIIFLKKLLICPSPRNYTYSSINGKHGEGKKMKIPYSRNKMIDESVIHSSEKVASYHFYQYVQFLWRYRLKYLYPSFTSHFFLSYLIFSAVRFLVVIRFFRHTFFSVQFFFVARFFFCYTLFLAGKSI